MCPRPHLLTCVRVRLSRTHTHDSHTCFTSLQPDQGGEGARGAQDHPSQGLREGHQHFCGGQCDDPKTFCPCRPTHTPGVFIPSCPDQTKTLPVSNWDSTNEVVRLALQQFGVIVSRAKLPSLPGPKPEGHVPAVEMRDVSLH